ncbi:M20 family metallopeptidase [Paraburkholderia megapolitana]|uniref:Acetylornithine deacetylase/Succinyl-diaminopimelate desuccinylase n=1 Tax=Paraburkholderia megapolitana TaxID=420953 RepID=A0A1I3LAP4_9BURK|nr:M20 family metallopeptidase [Paraburkholderia megapolitana]QDQ80626.1 M20 family metallopeptidase [Paraburkholderia megapolitana]SFI81630.1 Acetylornithine deacetylase/Succinyl-diaminopimelate desuccinylase [Paraburkholderia megapolitana]
MTTSQNTRTAAVDAAFRTFDSGALLEQLARRVACRTESQNPSRAETLHAYLTDEIAPALQQLGFTSRVVTNPEPHGGPLLIAERHEGAELPTVLTYGHGDVVRGYDDQWRAGLKPWDIVVEGDRWYGRGTADNKGQHSINFAALAAVLDARGGRLGYNVKVLFETGEEVSSPGLYAVCEANKTALAADLFLASDGPRVSAERPTLFLGSRGAVLFELSVDLRDGGHHSGNWGGVLRNPAVVLAHAIASLVDRHGRIAVEGLRPPPVSSAVRRALADIELGRDEQSPAIDPTWGEPGLTPTERVIAWNALEVLAFKSGNADAPVNAIPPSAKAVCQLRFVVGTDWERTAHHLETHFARHGFDEVRVKVSTGSAATRLDLEDPWVNWALASMRATTGKEPALLPNLGGTVPNDAFAGTLNLPTLWVPHSYPACSQHAPNEHLLGSVAREALGVMAGLWWDLGDSAASVVAARAAMSASASAPTSAASRE